MQRDAGKWLPAESKEENIKIFSDLVSDIKTQRE